MERQKIIKRKYKIKYNKANLFERYMPFECEKMSDLYG